MKKFVQSADWSFQPLFQGLEGLLVPMIATQADMSAVFHLNETAALIWKNLKDPISKNELGHRCTSHLVDVDIGEDTVLFDLSSCLEDFVKLGAVRELS